jgi:hypothetical protein
MVYFIALYAEPAEGREKCPTLLIDLPDGGPAVARWLDLPNGERRVEALANLVLAAALLATDDWHGATRAEPRWIEPAGSGSTVRW